MTTYFVCILKVVSPLSSNFISISTIRLTRWSPDPNRPTDSSNEGGYDLGGICPGGLVSDTWLTSL